MPRVPLLLSLLTSVTPAQLPADALESHCPAACLPLEQEATAAAPSVSDARMLEEATFETFKVGQQAGDRQTDRAGQSRAGKVGGRQAGSLARSQTGRRARQAGGQVERESSPWSSWRMPEPASDEPTTALGLVLCVSR